jgi:hypothetical protein
MKPSLLVLLIIFIIIGPLITIWSLNTIFPVLDIPFNFHTWLAISILSSLIGGAYKLNYVK